MMGTVIGSHGGPGTIRYIFIHQINDKKRKKPNNFCN